MSDAPSNEPENAGRIRRLARRANAHPRLLFAARFGRELVPGDSGYGDPLSTAGGDPQGLIGRRVAELGKGRPSVARELGLGAVQIWQSLSEAQGRGRGEEELTILFTDLVGFSSWTLEAGDAAALDLLRQVALANEPPVREHGGRVVKRLGDGLMAVFADPAEAVRAAHEASDRIARIDVEGFVPRQRAGIHLGRPRKLGGDYLGTDVNIAARVADAAKGGQVLVSDTVRERLADEPLDFRRRRFFRAEGAPRELAVYEAVASQE